MCFSLYSFCIFETSMPSDSSSQLTVNWALNTKIQCKKPCNLVRLQKRQSAQIANVLWYCTKIQKTNTFKWRFSIPTTTRKCWL